MEKTWKPTTAGILAIIAGILGIVASGIIMGPWSLGGLGGLFGFGMFSIFFTGPDVT